MLYGSAEWMIFFKSVCCLSELGLVRKNRHAPKYFQRSDGRPQINQLIFKRKPLFFLNEPDGCPIHK